MDGPSSYLKRWRGICLCEALVRLSPDITTRRETQSSPLHLFLISVSFSLSFPFCYESSPDRPRGTDVTMRNIRASRRTKRIILEGLALVRG